MRNESKNNEVVSNFFFLQKEKRKHMRVRDYYNLLKIKKTTTRKIKIILIRIWFNYSFNSCFHLKILS